MTSFCLQNAGFINAESNPTLSETGNKLCVNLEPSLETKKTPATFFGIIYEHKFSQFVRRESVVTFAAKQAVNKQPSVDLKPNLQSGESLSKYLSRN